MHPVMCGGFSRSLFRKHVHQNQVAGIQEIHGREIPFVTRENNSTQAFRYLANIRMILHYDVVMMVE